MFLAPPDFPNVFSAPREMGAWAIYSTKFWGLGWCWGAVKTLGRSLKTLGKWIFWGEAKNLGITHFWGVTSN